MFWKAYLSLLIFIFLMRNLGTCLLWAKPYDSTLSNLENSVFQPSLQWVDNCWGFLIFKKAIVMRGSLCYLSRGLVFTCFHQNTQTFWIMSWREMVLGKGVLNYILFQIYFTFWSLASKCNGLLLRNRHCGLPPGDFWGGTENYSCY